MVRKRCRNYREETKATSLVTQVQRRRKDPIRDEREKQEESKDGDSFDNKSKKKRVKIEVKTTTEEGNLKI